MKKSTLLHIVLFVAVANMFGQQDPIYTQYTFDKLAINPAYAGSSDLLDISAAYRLQFTGVDGAPNTAKLTFNTPIRNNSMGLGLKLYHDRLGSTAITSIMGVYAYHIRFQKGIKLSFGLELGIVNHSINFGNMVKHEQNDLAIAAGKESVIKPDGGAGLYFQTKKFYLGLSAYHLIEGNINLTAYDRGVVSKLSRHFFMLTGYYFELSDDFGIEPSVLVKTVIDAPVQFDANLNFIWKKMISLGGAYRYKDAIGVLVKYKMKDKFVIGYSYDFPLSQLSVLSNGAHEVMLSFRMEVLETRDKETHPRFYF